VFIVIFNTRIFQQGNLYKTAERKISQKMPEHVLNKVYSYRYSLNFSSFCSHWSIKKISIFSNCGYFG